MNHLLNQWSWQTLLLVYWEQDAESSLPELISDPKFPLGVHILLETAKSIYIWKLLLFLRNLYGSKPFACFKNNQTTHQEEPQHCGTYCWQHSFLMELKKKIHEIVMLQAFLKSWTTIKKLAWGFDCWFLSSISMEVITEFTQLYTCFLHNLFVEVSCTFSVVSS